MGRDAEPGAVSGAGTRTTICRGAGGEQRTPPTVLHEERSELARSCAGTPKRGSLRAIILAGGRGTRLAGYPKSLIPFGTWRLIDIQLAALSAAGLERPIVVGGPGGEEIEGRVPDGHFIMTGPTLTAMGSRGTLIAGLRAAGRGTDVLIVHGDVMFHPGVINGILESESPCSCLVRSGVEHGKPQARVVDGWVVELGAEGDCTYMGILRMSAEAAEDALAQCNVIDVADYMVAVSLIMREYPCEPVEVERYPIIDIDTQQDSLVAHRDIFPMVKGGIGLL